MSVQPGCKRTKRSPRLGHLGLRAPGRQPGWTSELTMRGQALVAQPVRTRVVLGVSRRNAGELLTADREAGLVDGGCGPEQLGTGHVVGDGAAHPLDLVRRGVPVSTGDEQPRCGHRDVQRRLAEPGTLLRLVWRLVLAEPHIAVRAEELRLTELVGQLGGE